MLLFYRIFNMKKYILEEGLREKFNITDAQHERVFEPDQEIIWDDVDDLAEMQYDDDVRDLPLNCRNVIQGLLNRLALRRNRVEKASDVYDFFTKNEVRALTDVSILLIIATHAEMSITDVQRVYEQGRRLHENNRETH